MKSIIDMSTFKVFKKNYTSHFVSLLAFCVSTMLTQESSGEQIETLYSKETCIDKNTTSQTDQHVGHHKLLDCGRLCRDDDCPAFVIASKGRSEKNMCTIVANVNNIPLTKVTTCRDPLNNFGVWVKSSIKFWPCFDYRTNSSQYMMALQDGLDLVCDMTSDGGGWVVFQRRVKGNVDFFNDWSMYKNGFGDKKGDFWLGLENIHQLTKVPCELRIELEFFGKRHYAKYKTFSVSDESEKYTMKVFGYSGNASMSSTDAFSFHNGAKFSTKDQDNNSSSKHCAFEWSSGWWFKDCNFCNPNAPWGRLIWMPHAPINDNANVTFVEMKIRPQAWIHG